MDQTIWDIIIVVLLAIIATILCLAFIFVLKSIRKISSIADQFKRKKEWIVIMVGVLIKLIDKIRSIFEKEKNPKK